MNSWIRLVGCRSRLPSPPKDYEVADWSRFLWVDFQLKDISYQKSDREILAALKRLPENMNETYERTILRIHARPKPERDLARKVLMWLTHAARPMRLDELAEAVAMETDTKSVEELESSMVNDYETLVTVCANLVVADTPVRPRGLSRCGVRFVHYSVQEYLLDASTDISSPENHSAVAKLKVEAQLAHAEMARLCITYLMACGKLDGDETKFSTLFHYADSSWMHHIRFLNEIHKDLLELSLSFFEHGAGFYTIQSKHYFGRGGRKYDWSFPLQTRAPDKVFAV